MRPTDTAERSNIYVLPTISASSAVVHIALLALASFLLPAASHILGLPVRSILPMHWPVILAGLCYGWRSGLVIGLLAPVTSYLISGMPLPHILPAMTVELAAYGFAAGFAREIFKLNWFLAAAISLVIGRLVFLSYVFLFRSVEQPFGEYIAAAMAPGIPAAIAQFLILSIIAWWWVSRNTSGSK
ncbi:ECF transporter S component [Leptolyngbya sp. 7M]|uniref:ECF transporter S component n=1 Tax=Leptolyngbya sp. 7M TaxID=2812896 RepID=UPI001B8B4F04|nr:ECF transporter S component [Leptolyngbya sp. 7M]QYO65937.1 ECF transporter S component [Leptolyngbya sp. 7M]